MTDILETIQFTCKNTELTPSLKSLVAKKFERLSRHADNIMSIHLTFEVNKLRQIAKATITLPKGQINAQQESKDMYTSIDGLIKKLIRQLDDYRNK